MTFRKLTPGEAAEHTDGATYLDRMLDGKPIWPRKKIPGWIEDVRFRPLGRGLERQFHAECNIWATGSGLDLSIQANIDLASERATTMILYHAMITLDSDPANPESAKPLAVSFEAFENHPAVTDVFIAHAWDEYEQVKAQVSPFVEDLPEDVLDEILEELKKNPGTQAYAAWPRSWLLSLLRSMASLLATSTGPRSDTSST